MSAREFDYEVVVGNLGTVYSGTSRRKASEAYAEYVRQSLAGVGRAAGESVVLTKDGEPIAEHHGDDFELP